MRVCWGAARYVEWVHQVVPANAIHYGQGHGHWMRVDSVEAGGGLCARYDSIFLNLVDGALVAVDHLLKGLALHRLWLELIHAILDALFASLFVVLS